MQRQAYLRSPTRQNGASMLETVHLDRAVHSAYNFIATNIDPLLQKLSDRLAVAQPADAHAFILDELRAETSGALQPEIESGNSIHDATSYMARVGTAVMQPLVALLTAEVAAGRQLENPADFALKQLEAGLPPVPPSSRPRARLQQARTIDAVVKHDAAIKVSDGTQATETEARDVAMDENDDIQMVNQYTMKHILGHGGFGTVKLAVEYEGTMRAQRVAVKILNKRKLKRKRVGRFGNALQGVQREVAVWKKLDHKHCVKLFEVIDDEENGNIYLVSELVQGGAIMPDALHATPLPVHTARQYFQQLLLGVQYLHHHGVVHRDIKPGNLLLTKPRDGTEPVVKLVDFGVSETFGSDDTRRNTVGTAAFMAPEMLTGEEFSGKAIDLWACGVTLYMFLYGSPPFVGSTMQDTYDKIQHAELLLPPLPPHDKGDADHLLSESLMDLLSTMLKKNPSERFSLDELMSQAWVCGFNSDVEAQAANPVMFSSTAANVDTQTQSSAREKLRRASTKIRLTKVLAGPRRWDFATNGELEKAEPIGNILTDEEISTALSPSSRVVACVGIQKHARRWLAQRRTRSKKDNPANKQ